MQRILLPLAAGLVMIGADASAQQDTTRRTGQMGQMQQQGDSKVLGAVIAANEAEVAAAELALTKTQNPDVRDYALMLRRDHSALLDKLRPLSGTPNAATPDDPTIREMKNQADIQHASLQRLDTAAFDSVYVEQMIIAHRKMLSDIDAKYLPGSQGQLRSALEGARPTVQAHLRQAESLRQKRGAMPMPSMRRDTSTTIPPTRRPPRL